MYYKKRKDVIVLVSLSGRFKESTIDWVAYEQFKSISYSAGKFKIPEDKMSKRTHFSVHRCLHFVSLHGLMDLFL